MFIYIQGGGLCPMTEIDGSRPTKVATGSSDCNGFIVEVILED